MADLQAQVERSGQFFPLDPPLADRATLGGVLATNQSGPLRCRYGGVRDLALGIRVVHADGTVTKGGAKVVKNATAYDITKLYVGSLGTLGVIVAASLRLYPRPPVEGAWEIALADAEQGQALAIRILGSHCVPTRVELLDRGDGQASLFISWVGILEAVEAQASEFRRLASGLGSVPLPIAQPEQTWKDLRDFPWRALRGEERSHRAIWRAGVLPSACAQGMGAIRGAAGARGVVSMAASVASGLIRGEVVARGVEDLVSCVRAARDAVTGMGGYLVILDAPVAVRAQVDVWGPAPDGLSLMQQLKDAFDSRRILNPGRFLGGI
jgi:glycolate oxidase FAD binding subunit